jgi:predicted metal-binding membrane protein
MLLMFGVGIGNLGWMLTLGAVMALEKNSPSGKKLSSAVGLALLACGALITLQHI